MPTHIQLHRSGVTGATPDVSTMLEGEPAVNLVDKKLFVKGADGSLITLVDAHASHDANSPAGSANQIQYRGIADVFAANSSFVFNPSSVRLGVGTSSPRETLEVSGIIQATGVSADGATFTTANINVANVAGSIVHTSDSDTRITFTNNVIEMQAGSQDPSLKIETGNVVKLGDPSEGGDGTLLTVSDSAEKVTIIAVNGLEVGQGDIVASSNVQVANSIVHQGDSNTKIEFDTDQILMRAGNTKFLEVNSNGVVHTPIGISGGGATFGSKGITSSGPIFVDNAPVTIKGSGDVTLNLIADTDNSGENDNPIISMGQDGAEARFNLGVVGDAGQIFTNSLANSAFLDTANSNTDLQFAVGGDMKMTLLDDGKVGVGTKAPREKLEVSGIIQAIGVSADGATFGDKGITVGGGGKFSGGITAPFIDVSGNISAATFVASSTVTAPGFIGTFIGNASSATSATSATQAIGVQVQGKNDDNQYKIIFADHELGTGTSNLAAKVDSGTGDAGLFYNPSRDILTTGHIHSTGVSADGATYGINGITMGGNIHFADSTFLGTATRTDSYTGQIETAADKTYTLDPKVATARTVTGFYIKSASGTVTATLKNGSDTVKAASVSDSSGNQTSLANTSVAADGVITIVTSSNSSALDVIFNVEYTTTL